MTYGFCGAHRSGKTTLAKKVAEDLGFTFLETNTSKFLKEEHGINPVDAHTLKDRLHLQTLLLDNHERQLNEWPRPLITDRTPLDMLTYSLSELTMNNCDEETGKLFNDYRERCIRVTKENYAAFIICDPLSTFKEDENKPKPNLGYQWGFQYLLRGAIFDPKLSPTAKLHQTDDDFDLRLETSKMFILECQHNIANYHSEQTFH